MKKIFGIFSGILIVLILYITIGSIDIAEDEIGDDFLNVFEYMTAIPDSENAWLAYETFTEKYKGINQSSLCDDLQQNKGEELGNSDINNEATGELNIVTSGIFEELEEIMKLPYYQNPIYIQPLEIQNLPNTYEQKILSFSWIVNYANCITTLDNDEDFTEKWNILYELTLKTVHGRNSYLSDTVFVKKTLESLFTYKQKSRKKISDEEFLKIQKIAEHIYNHEEKMLLDMKLSYQFHKWRIKNNKIQEKLSTTKNIPIIGNFTWHRNRNLQYTSDFIRIEMSLDPVSDFIKKNNEDNFIYQTHKTPWYKAYRYILPNYLGKKYVVAHARIPGLKPETYIRLLLQYHYQQTGELPNSLEDLRKTYNIGTDVYTLVDNWEYKKDDEGCLYSKNIPENCHYTNSSIFWEIVNPREEHYRKLQILKDEKKDHDD